MLTIINGFLAAAISLSLELAQSVYFFEEKKNGPNAQKKLITSIFQLRLILGIVVVIFCTLCFPIFNSLFFDNRLPWYYFALAFTGSLFIQLSVFSADIFVLLFRPWQSCLISIAQSFGSMATAIFIILIFKVGIFGIIAGTLIGSLCSAVWGWWMARDYLDFSSLNTEWWPRLFKFGLPSLPLPFAGWLLSNSDRILIMNILGPEQMGIYAVGFKVALILALVVGSIRIAWQPIALDAIQTDKGKSLLRNASCAYFGLGFSATIVLSFFAPTIIEIISPPEYFKGYLVVGLLSLYFVFDGCLSITHLGLLKNKKTYLITIIAIGCTLVNFTISIWLITSIGILGGAIGSLIAVMLRSLVSLIYSESYYHVKFMNRTMCLQFLLSVATILNILTFGSNLHSFLLSLLSISLICVQTYQKSEVFRHIFVRD